MNLLLAPKVPSRPKTAQSLQSQLSGQMHAPTAELTTLSEPDMLSMLTWFLNPNPQQCPVWWESCYHAKLTGFLPWIKLLQRDPLLDLNVLHKAALPLYIYPFKNQPDRLLCTNIYLTPEQRKHWESVDTLYAELCKRKCLTFKAHSRDFRRLIENKLAFERVDNGLVTARQLPWYLLR